MYDSIFCGDENRNCALGQNLHCGYKHGHGAWSITQSIFNRSFANCGESLGVGDMRVIMPCTSAVETNTKLHILDTLVFVPLYL